MTKYFSLFLLLIAMSCAEKTAETTTQAATEPAASTPTSTSAAPVDQAPATSSTSPVTQETQTTPATSQQPAATQVVPGKKYALTATYWILTELNGKNIEGKTAREMYIFFDPTSPQFKGHSGCNLVMGEAKTKGSNQMWFINLLPTSGPCNTPEIDTEFQKALAEVAGYTVTGNVLVLSKKGAVPVLKFRAKG